MRRWWVWLDVGVIAAVGAGVWLRYGREVPKPNDATSTTAPESAQGTKDSSASRSRISPDQLKTKRTESGIEDQLRSGALAWKGNDAPASEYPLSGELVESLRAAVAERERAGTGTYALRRDLALTLRGAGRDEESQEWALRAAESLAGNGTNAMDGTGSEGMQRLREVARLWRETGLANRGAGSHAFAESLARAAREGRLALEKGDAELLSLPLADGESRDAVRAATEGGTQGPCMEAGAVLVWACRRGDALAEWIAHVDQRIAETRGDARAKWLLLRGQADAVRTTPPQPGRRVAWNRKAMETAETEEGRRAVARETGRAL